MRLRPQGTGKIHVCPSEAHGESCGTCFFDLSLREELFALPALRRCCASAFA